MTKIIEEFYEAFKNLDTERMVACYHPEVTFEDPAFGELKGERAKNMWRMLIQSQKGKKFVVHYSNVSNDEKTGSANWEALYQFTQTKRWVRNQIEAKFKIKDGLIIEHRDHFNLFTWSCQAMGLQGYLVGWTPFFRRKLQERTNAMLTKFESLNE